MYATHFIRFSTLCLVFLLVKARGKSNLTNSSQPVELLQGPTATSGDKSVAHFSELLKAGRLKIQASTQRAAAQAIKNFKGKVVKRSVSQSLIAQYETMRVADPDPEILALLAQVYQLDYMDVVWTLARDKYSRTDFLTPPGISELRWRLWKAALKRFPNIARMEDRLELEERQLNAKVEIVENAEILDMSRMAEWQRNFENLVQLWIFIPDFQDEREPIRSAVVEHLTKGIRLLYFIREAELGPGQKFEFTQKRLADLAQISWEKAQELMVGIPLTSDEQRLIHANLVIANPVIPDQATGFRIIRIHESDENSLFGVRIIDSELEKIVYKLAPWVKEKLKDQNKEELFGITTPKNINHLRLVK